MVGGTIENVVFRQRPIFKLLVNHLHRQILFGGVTTGHILKTTTFSKKVYRQKKQDFKFIKTGVLELGGGSLQGE